jgi:hypothetical protein
MSNAAAAYYAYLARVDHERARVLRNFGYHASADYIQARARRYDRMTKSEGAAPLTDAAPCFPPAADNDDLPHTTSSG